MDNSDNKIDNLEENTEEEVEEVDDTDYKEKYLKLEKTNKNLKKSSTYLSLVIIALVIYIVLGIRKETQYSTDLTEQNNQITAYTFNNNLQSSLKLCNVNINDSLIYDLYAQIPGAYTYDLSKESNKIRRTTYNDSISRVNRLPLYNIIVGAITYYEKENYSTLTKRGIYNVVKRNYNIEITDEKLKEAGIEYSEDKKHPGFKFITYDDGVNQTVYYIDESGITIEGKKNITCNSLVQHKVVNAEKLNDELYIYDYDYSFDLMQSETDENKYKLTIYKDFDKKDIVFNEEVDKESIEEKLNEHYKMYKHTFKLSDNGLYYYYFSSEPASKFLLDYSVEQ